MAEPSLPWPAGWPRTPSNKRRRGGFSYRGTETSKWGDGTTHTTHPLRSITRAMAVKRVQEEVARMGGAQLRVDTGDAYRQNGELRSESQQPRDKDPGVVVSFRLPGNRPVVFPCDAYTTTEQNLAAVAATIEAKRAIERHGVSTLAREFEGYLALPSGDAAADQAAAAAMSRPMPMPAPAGEDPHAILGVVPGAAREVVEGAWRALARTHHPDKGGDPAAFDRITKARDAILAQRT